MLRTWILLWLFAARVLIVSVAQNAPTIPVAKISLPDPAFVGMPIWMQVESPTNYTIRYPASTTPNDFYCNEVEVQQNGRLLSPLKGVPPGGRGGPACGFLGVADIAQSKRPIHLQYPLTIIADTQKQTKTTAPEEPTAQNARAAALSDYRTPDHPWGPPMIVSLCKESHLCPSLQSCIPWSQHHHFGSVRYRCWGSTASQRDFRIPIRHQILIQRNRRG